MRNVRSIAMLLAMTFLTATVSGCTGLDDFYDAYSVMGYKGTAMPNALEDY